MCGRATARAARALSLFAAVIVAPAARGDSRHGAVSVAVDARSVQPGELVVLTIDAPATARLRVDAFDRAIPAFRTDAAWRALVGIDLDVKPGAYAVSIAAGASSRAWSCGRRRFARGG
jgi:hypothetical protein